MIAVAQNRPLFGFLRLAPPGPRKQAEIRCRVLEVMAASVARDVPLGPVIATAAEENRGFARRALVELRDLLEQGLRLGAALNSCTILAFPEHTVAAVEAADGTPRLAAVLAAAARDGADVDNRRASLWAAALYPLLVVAVVGGIAGGVLGPTRDRLDQVMDSMDVQPHAALAVASRAGSIAGWIALGAAELLVAAWIVRRLPRLSMGLSDMFRSAWQALPGVRGAARLGGAARLLNALAPCIRAATPLHDALRDAAGAAGCRSVSDAALAAAALAEEGASVEALAAVLLLPAAVRARFVLAATRAPEQFAEAVRVLAEDCTERYREALESRMRRLQPALILLVGALVFTQLLGIFATLETVRRAAVPTW